MNTSSSPQPGVAAGVSIRPALPGPPDEATIAAALQQADPEVFWALLGASAPQCLRRIIAKPGHAWSTDRAQIAELNGAPVGALIGGRVNRQEPTAPFGLPSTLVRLRFFAARMALKPLHAFLSQLERDAWYVNAVAVTANARGRGVGRALLRDAIGRARDSGASSFVLHVNASNTSAIRLYEDEGLSITDTWAPWYLAAQVKVHRMQMRLR